MPVKVSVVVPVYNPGAHIDAGIDSLLRQSLPDDEYEAIFVDDGSTDGTGERLDRLAAEHANVRVFHIPNSGWPGRPRNVGMDAAAGEYVLFMDNDDRLDEEALERLYARAVADGADVVVGKVVGHGRMIPRELFAADRRDVRLGWPPLLHLLTPHKLFRRAFVEEHGLRFPEGRVRLEDHAFVVPAFFAARSISILADHPIYHWIKRDDETNASSGGLGPGYWRSLRGVLDVVEANTEPGELRERLLSHWARTKLLMRLGGAAYGRREAGEQEELFHEIGAVMRERIAPGVVRRLGSALRIRARLLEARRLDGLRALAEAEGALAATATLRSAAWDDGELRFEVEAQLAGADGRPVTFDRDGERLLRRLPAGLPGAEAVLPEDRDVGPELGVGAVELFARRRGSREEYLLQADYTVHEREQEDGTVAVAFAASARLDPATAATGAVLADGVWDVSVTLDVGGIVATARVAVGDVEVPTPGLTAEDPSRAVFPYATVEGNLSVDVGGERHTLLKAARATSKGARAARRRGEIELSVPLAAAASGRGAGLAAELLLERADASPARRLRVPARLVAEDGVARLEARVPFRRLRRTDDAIGPGAWLLAATVAGRTTPLRLTLGLARDGSARIRHTQQGRPRPGAVPATALRRGLSRALRSRRT